MEGAAFRFLQKYVPATSPKWTLRGFLDTLKIVELVDTLESFGVDSPEALCEAEPFVSEMNIGKKLHEKRLIDGMKVVQAQLGWEGNSPPVDGECGCCVHCMWSNSRTCLPKPHEH